MPQSYYTTESFKHLEPHLSTAAYMNFIEQSILRLRDCKMFGQKTRLAFRDKRYLLFRR